MRLALGLTLLFSGVSVVTLGFAYFQIRGSIEETIAANLDQQVSEFRMATTLDALAVQVTTESIAADPENRVFALLTPSGASFGNARAEISDNEVRLLDNESGRPLGDDGYISRVVPMAGGVLVVAESQGPISDLKETFLRMIG
ncbi:MAG: hypothetical protein U1D35_01265, partial [Paracoccaceae bacterium]|nr:hypothetical protein [Paracoccaceae bacterium]